MLRKLISLLFLICHAETASPRPAKIPTQDRFELHNAAGELCFLFQGGIFVQVVYQTVNRSIFNVTNIDVGKSRNIAVVGQCAQGNRALPIIVFDHGINTHIAIEFYTSVQEDGFVYMQHEKVKGQLSKMDFPDMLLDEMQLNGEDNIHDLVSKPGEVCLCNETFTDPIDKDISLVFGQKTKWQAFGVHGGFSNKGVWCVLPSRSSENHPIMTYTVKKGNIFCIVLKGGLKLTIPYQSGTGFVIEKVAGLPNNTISDTYSSCVYGDEQYLRLDFYNQWMLAFHFARDGDTFSVTQVALTYFVNDVDFPNFRLGFGGLLTVVTDMSGTFKGSTTGSYKCDSGESLLLNNGIILYTNNFQVKAFSVDRKPDFSNRDVTECDADKLTKSIGPDANSGAGHR